MPGQIQSLLEYLTIENPTISQIPAPDATRPSKKHLNTKNKRWHKPKYIVEWDDFNVHSLYNGSLKSLLAKQSDKFSDHTSIPLLPYRTFDDELSFQTFLGKWTQAIVSDALQVAQNLSPSSQTSHNILMASGRQGQRAGKFLPDWAGILWTDSTSSKPVNILPGETKLASKWSSASIEIGTTKDVYMDTDWIQPIKQIFTYCCLLNARYGYIITEKELVVVRVRPSSVGDLQSSANSQCSDDTVHIPKNEASPSRGDSTPGSSRQATIDVLKNGTLEYKAIPWRSSPDEQDARGSSLTINLALWWLHMMALEDHDIRYTYPPLAEATRSLIPKPKDASLVGLTIRIVSGIEASWDNVSGKKDESHNTPSQGQQPKRMTRSQTKRN